MISRGLKTARFHKQNVSGRVTLLPETELRPVGFNKTSTKRGSIFHEIFKVCTCFPKHSFQCQFLFPRCKLRLPCTAGNFNENLQKFCKHKQASTHLSFASNPSKGQNFASTFKLNGTIRYPYCLVWGDTYNSPLPTSGLPF